MLRRQQLTSLAASAAMAVLVACANQSMPTGGPRDKTPPTLRSSTPSDGQVNYHSREIEMVFDELVQLNDPTQQIIITPRLNKSIKAVARRNKVFIEVDEDWQDSTTYTMNFREAVGDVTEKNPAQNLKIAFSTGDYIDSLSIQGKVIHQMKDQPMAGITVGTTIYSDTFSIFKHPPQWFAQTDKKGNYLLENLKPGKYIVFAFDDKNKNLTNESRSEMYGFLTQPVQLDSNVMDTNFLLQKAENRPMAVTQTRGYKSYSNIRLSVNLRSFVVTSPETKVLACYGDEPSQIEVYPQSMPADSILISLYATDSLMQSLDTTLYIKLNPEFTFTEQFSLAIESPNLFTDRYLFSARLNFNKPLRTINFDSLYVQLDSLTALSITSENVTIDTAANRLSIERTLPRDTIEHFLHPEPTPGDSLAPPQRPKPRIIQLMLRPGAFISMAGDTSRLGTNKVQVVDPETRGIIIAQVACKTPFIIQLLDQNFKVVAEKQNVAQSRFDNLVPGTYQLRLLVDVNGNGYWDAGNFFTHTQPEPILFYHNDKDDPLISIKANWELGPLLITYE